MKRASARPVRESTTSPGLRKELLLYVEDDDDNWDVAELRLRKSYNLLRASSDAEACALIRQHRNEIDVVLMDIELRGSELNGVELTELIRGNRLPPERVVPAYARNLPTISKPVVYVTAHGARYTNVQLMLSGADKVISKPVDFVDLQQALTDLLQDRTAF